MSRYEVVYFDAFFTGDRENKCNWYSARDWSDAYDFWNTIKQDFPGSYIKDNDGDMCFDGEWY